MRRLPAKELVCASQLPIIMLTEHGERTRVLDAVRHGVHEFLLKPVSHGALKARLHSALANSAEAATAANQPSRASWQAERSSRVQTKARNCRPHVGKIGSRRAHDHKHVDIAHATARLPTRSTSLPDYILALDQGTTSTRAIRVRCGRSRRSRARRRNSRNSIPRPAGSSTIRKQSGRARSRPCGRP